MFSDLNQGFWASRARMIVSIFHPCVRGEELLDELWGAMAAEIDIDRESHGEAVA